MAQTRKSDLTLFFTIVAMVVFGLVIVTSASSVMAEIRYKSNWHFVIRQAGWAVASFGVLIFFKRLNYRNLNQPVMALAPLGIVLAMLAAVYFLDYRRHRWLNMGTLSIQPSEFAKPALIVFLAWFISMRLRAINHSRTLMPAMLAFVVLCGTVVIADLGTAVVLATTAVVLFYVAGLERKYLATAAVLAMFAVSLAIAMKPYRLARMAAKFDPQYRLVNLVSPSGKLREYIRSSLATSSPGYQAWQSRITVGTGGLTGVGLAQGRQQIFFLPEAHTDFIYAVVGEELGLFGATAVLAGFFVILWRGLRLFWLAPDDFGKYLALGVTVCIVIQALMNMSVVLDMGPTKGIPLPMISYGGSSLLSTLTLLGMLLSVSESSG